VNLRLPALRERPADLVALSDFFVRKYASANAMPVKAISAGARSAIAANGWRGNVRELENAMHRAILLAAGAEIEAGDIRGPDGSPVGTTPGSASAVPAFHGGAPASAPGPAEHAAAVAGAVTRNLVGRTIEAVEQEMILDTLRHCYGNRTHAAQILDAGVAVPAPGLVETRQAFG
jgi:two-component system, response regulator FlrC